MINCLKCVPERVRKLGKAQTIESFREGGRQRGREGTASPQVFPDRTTTLKVRLS